MWGLDDVTLNFKKLQVKFAYKGVDKIWQGAVSQSLEVVDELQFMRLVQSKVRVLLFSYAQLQRCRAIRGSRYLMNCKGYWISLLHCLKNLISYLPIGHVIITLNL